MCYRTCLFLSFSLKVCGWTGLGKGCAFFLWKVKLVQSRLELRSPFPHHNFLHVKNEGGNWLKTLTHRVGILISVCPELHCPVSSPLSASTFNLAGQDHFHMWPSHSISLPSALLVGIFSLAARSQLTGRSLNPYLTRKWLQIIQIIFT